MYLKWQNYFQPDNFNKPKNQLEIQSFTDEIILVKAKNKNLSHLWNIIIY